MFITLTTRNEGKPELVNVREIRRVWVEPADGAALGNEVDSALMMIVEFVDQRAWTRYVPVGFDGQLDPEQTNAETALRNFSIVARDAQR